MNGKVHVAVGTAAVFCICLKYPNGLDFNGIHVIPVISLLTAAAGSYAPDIDMGTTHAGKEHAVASKVINKVGGGHRGITHTLLIPIVLAVLMYYVNAVLFNYKAILCLLESLLFGFEAGWIMHIFADLFNGKGCPLFWPIMKGKVHVMDLPSEGAVPWVFASLFICVIGSIAFGGLFG